MSLSILTFDEFHKQLVKKNENSLTIASFPHKVVTSCEGNMDQNKWKY